MNHLTYRIANNLKSCIRLCVATRKSLYSTGQGSIPQPTTLFSTTFPQPDLDWEYLTNESNTEKIHNDIQNRKGVGDIYKVQALYKQLQKCENDEERTRLRDALNEAALELPNSTHPSTPIGDESCAVVREVIGSKQEFTFKPKTVVELGNSLGVLRTDNVGHTSGSKSYYFYDKLAQLESALVDYTLGRLLAEGFDLVSVPNIIHPAVIEGCGFKTTGDRNQIFKLHPDKFGGAGWCLAGTGEMPLAASFINETMQRADLPRKVATVSQCYRAETSDVEEERGIYRVHQFTKVEMFGVTSPDASASLVDEFVVFQRRLFTDLGLHVRIMNMPSTELGAPAHSKVDVEAWMHGKGFWGEVSSASNCTDYQARRLNIRYTSPADTSQPNDPADSVAVHAHTVNGTACALPRMVMALVEANQTEAGDVEIPAPLRPYMPGGVGSIEGRRGWAGGQRTWVKAVRRQGKKGA